MPADLVLQLEETACCICGSRDGAPSLRGHDVEFRTCANAFVFLECRRCGHLYLSPRPRVEDMDLIYVDYLTTNTASAYYPSTLVASIKDRVFDARRLRPMLAALRPESNVLDIGAGAGRLLKLIRRTARIPVRLYANDVAFTEPARHAFRDEGIGVFEGPIEQWATPLRFDAMTMIHVIEHVLDPRAVFRWIADHLNPGGVLYLETPDAAALCRRIFGDSWGMTHFPRHLNLFRTRDLKILARDVGLTVARQGSTTSAPAWNMSIRNRLGMDALTKRRSIFEMFNYSNVLTLGAFTMVDVLLMALRVPTSTQTLVAVKPR